MNPIEAGYYRVIGVKKEFPELNPISAAFMKIGAEMYVRKHNVVIEGHPLPKDDAAIVTGNHIKSKDPHIAGKAGFMSGRLIRTVVKKSLVEKGAYESREYLESIGDHEERAEYRFIEAFTMRGIGVIPVLRDTPASNIAALRQSYKVLDTGQLLGLFIQDTRDEEGLLRRLQPGVAHVATRPKYRDIPIHAIAFEEDRTTLLEPFTYNQERDRLGRDIDIPELTVIIADRIAAALPQRVQNDWVDRREQELTRLRAA